MGDAQEYFKVSVGFGEKFADIEAAFNWKWPGFAGRTARTPGYPADSKADSGSPNTKLLSSKVGTYLLSTRGGFGYFFS